MLSSAPRVFTRLATRRAVAAATAPWTRVASIATVSTKNTGNSNCRNNYRKEAIGAAFAAAATGLVVAAADGDNNSNYGSSNNAANAELRVAVLDSDLATVQRLRLSAGKPVDVNVRSTFGWCPVHVAAVTSNVALMQQLINMGADVNKPDEHDELRAAVIDYFKEQQRVLTAADARPLFVRSDAFKIGTLGFTSLHYAVLANNEPMVQLLVENGADPDARDRMGHTPLENAAPSTAAAMLPVITAARASYLRRHEEEIKALRRKYPLEAVLKQNIVGQQGPINAVAAAVRRRQNGWQDTEHPLVFLFLGSSGIGKTELAKQMAAYLHPKNPDVRVHLLLRNTYWCFHRRLSASTCPSTRTSTRWPSLSAPHQAMSVTRAGVNSPRGCASVPMRLFYWTRLKRCGSGLV